MTPSRVGLRRNSPSPGNGLNVPHGGCPVLKSAKRRLPDDIPRELAANSPRRLPTTERRTGVAKGFSGGFFYSVESLGQSPTSYIEVTTQEGPWVASPWIARTSTG